MTAQFRGRRPLGPRLHFPPLRRPSDYPIPAPRKNVPIHDADRVFQFHQPRQRPTIGFFSLYRGPHPSKGSTSSAPVQVLAASPFRRLVEQYLT